jgi:hypothetical protein
MLIFRYGFIYLLPKVKNFFNILNVYNVPWAISIIPIAFSPDFVRQCSFNKYSWIFFFTPCQTKWSSYQTPNLNQNDYTVFQEVLGFVLFLRQDFTKSFTSVSRLAFVAQAGLKFVILLPLYHEYTDYMHEAPCAADNFIAS